MSATASSTVHTMALGLGSLDQRSNATASSSRINSHSGKSLRVRIRSPVIRGDGTASPPVSQRSTASVPSSRRRTEEKRVLPVRMRGLGGSTGTGSSVTGKDVEDMIFQCFTRALFSSNQPSESMPICLVRRDYAEIKPTLLPRSTPEPAWWSTPMNISALVPNSPSTSRNELHPVPSPSPSKIKRASGTAQKEDSSLNNERKRVIMPGFRKVTEEDSVVLDEKRKTRGAHTSETEDSSDARYHALHLKYERYESRARLAERQRMEHARYKLNMRIEYLENLNDDVWEGAVSRMMQRGQRVRLAEEATNGKKKERIPISQENESTSIGAKEPKTDDVLTAEKEQNRYRETMDAGAKLLHTLSIPGLKRELIREGKELLARYDRLLAKPKPLDRQISASLPSLRVEKRSNSRAMSRDSTITPPPTSPEDMPIDLPPLQHDVRLESQEVSHPVVAKRSRLTANSSSMKETTGLQTTKPSRSSARNAASATGPTSVSASTSILPFVEPYYPITTESGKPAIVQAADKRLAAMENAEKAKELHAKLKIGGTKGPVGDLTRSERRSRNESLLPFGVSAPEMLAWHMEFDLDGDFWKPMMIERGYAAASTLPTIGSTPSEAAGLAMPTGAPHNPLHFPNDSLMPDQSERSEEEVEAVIESVI